MMKTQNQALIFNPLTIFDNLSFLLSRRLFLRIFWFLSLALFISLLFFVFLQINRLARETDFLRASEQNLTALSKQNQEWKIKSTQVNHQLLAGTLIQELNFEKVEKIHFIEKPEKKVVIR